MVKARRNRQPRNWQDMTGVRSHGGLIDAKSKSTPIAIPKEESLKKVNYNLYRLDKQLKKYRRNYNRMVDSPEKADLAGRIAKLEVTRSLSLMSKIKLEKGIIEDMQKRHKAQQTLREEMRVHQERLKEIKPGKPQSPMPESQRFKNKPGKGKIVERVERVGTKRRIRRKWVDK